MKTVRTMLYGDCEFLEWELELLHTPIMQRMYNLKQLGFADRVYPDAIHSRFNHLLGVTARADEIINGVVRSLEKEKAGNLPDRKTFKFQSNMIEISELIDHVNSRKTVIRLIGLLHDIGHIPFGHTLEDELNIFSVKHDDPFRQVDFFNILMAEFTYSIILKYNPSNDPEILNIVQKNELSEKDRELLVMHFMAALKRVGDRYGETIKHEIGSFIIDLRTSMVALFYLDNLHGEKKLNELSDLNGNAINNLFINRIIEECQINRSDTQKEFDLHLDAFMLDIIGNTICADLLDYAKRDSKMTGLCHDYDDRIFKYYSLVSYTNSKDADPAIRLCLQLFTNKFRYDVVSEIVTILRTRYLLSERVLFHPTKCAAGAMLGASVYMMGIDKAELDFFRIGDAVFIKLIDNHASKLLKVVSEMKKQYDDKKTKNVAISDTARFVDKNKYTSSYWDTLFDVLNGQKNDVIDESYIKAFKKVLEEEIENKAIGVNNEELFSDSPDIAHLLENINERFFAASRLVWQIKSRQYYNMIFRIAKIDGSAATVGEMRKLADKYRDARNRYMFERKIEKKADLPYGSLLIHCPKFDTILKSAKVLVFGLYPENTKKFEEIDEEHELYTLRPYIEETKNLSSAYESIWNMYFFLQESLMHKWPLVEYVISDMLKESIGRKIENSEDLHYQLLRDYYNVAKPHLDVLKYMDSKECKVKAEYDKEFAKYIEAEVFHAKKKNITPEMLCSEWVAMMNDKQA